MTEATAVAIVHIPTNLPPDDPSKHGADYNRDSSVGVITGLGTDGAANDSTDYGPNLLMIAAAFDDTIVLRPLVSGIANVIWVMFLTPPVRGRLSRRISHRGNTYGSKYCRQGAKN
ncbi:MAG: hypothetical protein ABI616_08010 [Pseudomonadota bacterium]